MNKFSIVVIPDTHYDYKITSDNFTSLMNWIVANRGNRNIKAVVHLGDIGDERSSTAIEQTYQDIRTFVDIVNEASIPLLIAMGNHDYDNQLKIDRTSTVFNTYLGLDMHEAKSWFGGAFEGKAENMYHTIKFNNKKILLMSLEYAARNKVLGWANGVVETYSDYDILLFTHGYLGTNGERDILAMKSIVDSPISGDEYANSGEEIWDKFIKLHKNIKAVFSGHFQHPNMAYSTSVGVAGNLVHQFYQNWQNIGVSEGGSLTTQIAGGRAQASFARIFEFDFDKKLVNIANFIPPLGIEGEEAMPKSFKYPLTYPLVSNFNGAIVKHEDNLREISEIWVKENGELREIRNIQFMQ